MGVGVQGEPGAVVAQHLCPPRSAEQLLVEFL